MTKRQPKGAKTQRSERSFFLGARSYITRMDSKNKAFSAHFDFQEIRALASLNVGNGGNTVSESTVSTTELSEFFSGLTEFRGVSSVSSF